MNNLDRQLAIQYYKSHLIRKIKRLTIRNPFFMFLRNVWLFRRELWNFRKFDYKYNLDLFCRSLEHTRDFMASPNAVCESSAQAAEEIYEFLEAMDNFHNHVEIGIGELGYDFSPLRGEHSEEEKEKGINRGVKPVTELGPEIPLFSVYAQVMLQDNAFYLPKEIYKKQRVVDNQRLLRSLNNDKKYTEMIDGQYR